MLRRKWSTHGFIISRNRTSQKPKLTLAMMVRLYVNQRLVDKVKLEKMRKKEPKKYPTFGEDWSSCDDFGMDVGPENGVGHAAAVIRSSPRKRALADSSDDDE